MTKNKNRNEHWKDHGGKQWSGAQTRNQIFNMQEHHNRDVERNNPHYFKQSAKDAVRNAKN